MKLMAIKYRIHLTAILLYTFLTVIFTYPVTFSINNVPGGGDVFFYLWDLWWIKAAVLSYSSPYWTPYLFHPSGLSLVFTTITPLNGIISIPLQFIFGQVISYNLLWLLSFIIAGYGTFLLVNYFTKNLYASFISGLIFAFSPYHFAHALGHLSLLSIEWIPFYILYLFKTINEQNFKNGLIAAIFLILIGLSDTTYLLYVLLFTALLLLFYLITERKIILQKDVIQRFLLMAIISVVGCFPFIYSMLTGLMTPNLDALSLGGFEIYSADFLGFFIPSQFHPIFGKIVEPIYQNFTGNVSEYTIFAGYSVLILAFFALIKIKTNEIKFWMLATIAFILLSLGPIFHFNGIVYETINGINYTIPLPYSVIMHVPIISMARAPVRWDVMIMLTLSVLAGFGITYVLNKYQKRCLFKIRMNTILVVLFSALILFEFLAIPYPMTNPHIPDVYNFIEQDKGDYAIIDIPGFNHPEYMYYQTFHGKKIITGYAHVPDPSWKFIQNTPFIYNLLILYQVPQKTMVPQKDILNQDNTNVGASLLNYYNIKYILIHKNDLTSEQKIYISALLRSSLNTNAIVFNDSDYTLYKIPNQSIKTFAALNTGWSNRELWNDTPSRWMAGEASILIYSNENKTSTLSMQILSFYRPRTLKISLDGSEIAKMLVPANYITVSTPVTLHQGENIIRFQIPEGCEKPNSIPELNNKDTNCLSIAMQNITIT